MGYIYVVFVLGIRAVSRSAEWQTEALLFRSGLSVCPLNAKVHYNIAKNAGDAGNRTLAVLEYREALRSVTWSLLCCDFIILTNEPAQVGNVNTVSTFMLVMVTRQTYESIFSLNSFYLLREDKDTAD